MPSHHQCINPYNLNAIMSIYEIQILAQVSSTVEPLLTHTPLWTPETMCYLEVMDYERYSLVQNDSVDPKTRERS